MLKPAMQCSLSVSCLVWVVIVRGKQLRVGKWPGNGEKINLYKVHGFNMQFFAELLCWPVACPFEINLALNIIKGPFPRSKFRKLFRTETSKLEFSISIFGAASTPRSKNTQAFVRIWPTAKLSPKALESLSFSASRVNLKVYAVEPKTQGSKMSYIIYWKIAPKMGAWHLKWYLF